MRSVRSSAVVEIHTALRTHLLVTLSLVSPMWVSAAAAEEHEEVLIEEDFESGLSRWQLDNADSIAIVPEPGTPGNHVLRLTPEENIFTHAILEESEGWSHLRIEGRFLFPTEGDGYLGFIYNYQESIGAEGVDRMDFGCIYVKPNGSYVRVSPHHDGNPSWRLYEEYRFDLEGGRRIQVGSWYDFRLDVRGRWAELFIEDMSKPVERFIWSDYLTSEEHPGARISLLPTVGENEILIRVHGRRFAGGGLFVELIRPQEGL